MEAFNPLNITGRRYLITGAASGMGRAAAIYLSKLGADLLLVDINLEELQVTRKKCKATDCILAIDLTDIKQIQDRIMADVAQNGKLSGFVHCAGRPYIAPLKMVNEDKAMDIYRLNSYSAIEIAKIFTNRKVYVGENGSIVLISSVYGVVGSAANVGYAMTKGAIQGITRALAIELAPKKIRVNCIAPGFVKTEMADAVNHNFDLQYEQHIENLHPLGWGSPDDIAACIAYLFSDMSKWVTGAILNIDGGFTAQ